MKKLFLLATLIMSIGFSFGQNVPQGMKYQAVARNTSGNIIANQPISIKINLVTQQGSNVTQHYSELHTVTTNQLGLFSLTIGEGKTEAGAFSSIPWSTSDIWMQVAIKDKSDYVIISNSKLLTVPFAFHSQTANTLTGNQNQGAVTGSAINNNNGITDCSCKEGVASIKVLYLGGGPVDIKVYEDKDLKRLIISLIQVNNRDIVTITAAGNKKLSDELYFKTSNNLFPVLHMPNRCNDATIGETYGNYTVMARTDFKSGATCSVCDIQQDWKVGGNVLEEMCNRLGTKNKTDVVVITDNTERMRVKTDGDIDIKKNVSIEGSLNVTGATTLNNSFAVIKNAPEFVASITNTNDGEGDGLNIKLGKAKSVYSPPALPTLDEGTFEDMKNLLSCEYDGNKATLLGNIVLNGLTNTGLAIGGLAVAVGNIIIKQINDGLELPFKIGPFSTPEIFMWGRTEIFPGIDLDFLGEIDPIYIPGLTIPSVPVIPEEITVMPKLPEISIPGLPSFDFNDLSFWSIPSICLSDDAGSTPMNNTNEFIRFTDKNDKKMGSVRGVSLNDFAKNYLNPIFLFKLRGAITSSTVDKFHARYHFQAEIFKVIQDYATLGVEYSSGNGDYAEWLPRIDKSETINAGDIVGVVSGKITKNLKDAEQVMVVSSNPIILGNIPAEGKHYEGNNIAFMGQVPVKIVGPVSTGDYIIGKSNTPGYGIAKHPNKMSIEDFKNAVGRSWVTDVNDGPKMVNTVVGIHNNSFINIVKDLKQKTDENDARLKAIENRLNMPVLIKNKLSKQPLK